MQYSILQNIVDKFNILEITQIIQNRYIQHTADLDFIEQHIYFTISYYIIKSSFSVSRILTLGRLYTKLKMTLSSTRKVPIKIQHIASFIFLTISHTK
jgi:hypothetical protein